MSVLLSGMINDISTAVDFFNSFWVDTIARERWIDQIQKKILIPSCIHMILKKVSAWILKSPAAFGPLVLITPFDPVCRCC